MGTWASYAATQGNQRPPSSRNRLPTVAVLIPPAPPSAHQPHNVFALPVEHALLSQRHDHCGISALGVFFHPKKRTVVPRWSRRRGTTTIPGVTRTFPVANFAPL